MANLSVLSRGPDEHSFSCADGNGPPEEEHLHRLLYLSVITVMEAYLFEAFMKTVLADKKLIRKFFESELLSEERIPVKEVFDFVERGEENLRKNFVNFVWHRLSSVAQLYSKVLDITFGISDDLDEAIRIRHDIVHRNGRTENGKERIITRTTVEGIASEVEALVNEIESQVNQRKTNLNNGTKV